MKESFLHYIWQFQYFKKEALQTSDGNALEVYAAGILNSNAGPDFQSAKVRIGSIEWAGSVEVHVNASDWNDHHHFADQAYDNVVLHVVWRNDKSVHRSDGTLIPTLELKGKVDESLIHSYKKLMESSNQIACEKLLPSLNSLLVVSMVDSALVQRLEAKAEIVIDVLKKCNNDWEQTAFELLAKNFGFKINSDPFQQLTKSLSYKILLKHSNNLTQIEALLFGQAGLLDIEVGDDYYQLLRREYILLKGKYSLSTNLKKANWKFLRLRPANFPTIRIAQFASLIFSIKNIFSILLEAYEPRVLKNLFAVTQSAYWQEHYQFNRKAKSTIAGFGEASIDNVMINTVAPLLVAYGKTHANQDFVDRATHLLQQITPENNAIVRKWQSLHVAAENAFDSQGLIELHNSFCIPKKCLDCNIGAAIIKPSNLGKNNFIES